MADNELARGTAFAAACACACARFSIAYIVAQLFEWSGALGSAGGSQSGSTPRCLAAHIAAGDTAATVGIRDLPC